VVGRLDSSGRLVDADPELAALQTEAGSHLGEQLALPQIAAIARLARKLGVPVTRAACVAGAEQDVELWVSAVPDGDGVALSLQRWTFRAPAGPRLTSLVPPDQAAASASGASGEWSADDELRLVAVGAGLADLLGIAPEAAARQPLTKIFRLEEDEDGDMPLVAALASRRDFIGQRARVRGGETVLLLSGEVVITADGGFAGFTGRAVAEQAPVAEVPATTSAASAALDNAIDEALRTPLGRIIASADRIVERSDGPLRADYATYASDISSAARHLLSVIRAMNEAPGQERDRLDLAALVADACSLFETEAEARGIAIAAELGAPLHARGEPRGVVQILVNLIGNALRHSPEDGVVAVSFERSGGQVMVHVADQGPGIEPADQQRIFERFEQATAGEGGTGLGLAISLRLARAMGGDIGLVSAPGQGARFTLSLAAV